MDIKTNVEFLKSENTREAHAETQTEYTLPDYNPDVRKILFTSAEVQPSGKYVSDGEIEFSGIIVYNLVYSDVENNIFSTSFSSDYDYTVKCNADTFKDCVTDTRVSNYAIRLVGPRKVSVKASVSAVVRMCERGEVLTSGSAFNLEESPEVLTCSAKVRASFSSAISEREYAESLGKLEGAIADEVAVIYTGAEVICSEVSAEEGSALVLGSLKLSAVIKNGDAPAYLVERTLPIEESVSFDEISADMVLVPELSVSSLKANVNADDSGCDVVMSAIVEMSVVGEKNQEIELISDAYMRGCEVENSYEDFSYTELCWAGAEKRTHNAELARSELDSQTLREVVFITATPKLESVTTTAEGVALAGEVKYTGVALEVCEDGGAAYVPIKFSSEFEENVNINCQNNGNLRFDVKVTATSASSSLDAEKLYASSELCFNILALSDKSKQRVCASEAKGDSLSESSGARVVVYYPDSDDTLFSVAKRYRTTVQKLARDNSIDVHTSGGADAPIGAVKRLLIYG